MYSSYCFSPRRFKSDSGLCTSLFCAVTALRICGQSWVSVSRAARQAARHLQQSQRWTSRGHHSPPSAPGDVSVFCSIFVCERTFLCFPWKEVFASRYFAHPGLSNRLQPSRVASLGMLSTFPWFACLLSHFLWEKDQKETPFTWPQLKKMGIYVHISSFTKLLEFCLAKQPTPSPTSAPYPTHELPVTME